MKNMFRFLWVFTFIVTLASCTKELSSDEYLANARSLLEEKDYSAAIIELKNAVKADPQSPEARLLLGATYLDLGDFASAEKELQKARENKASYDSVVPLLAEALSTLGKHEALMELNPAGLSRPEDQAGLLAAQGVSILSTGGDIWQASELIEDALAADPESSRAMLASAKLALRDGSTAAAREKLERALEIDPTYATAWGFLGEIEWRRGELDQAEHAYSQAIEFARNDSAYRLQRALVFIQSGSLEKAQKEVNILQKQFSPQQPGVSYAQGLIQLRRNELSQAITSLDAATLAGNSYPLAYFYLALIHSQQGNLAQAQSNSDKFLAIAPNHPWARKLAASLRLRAGKSDEAEELLRPVVTAFPGDITALNLLAASLASQGKSDESLDLLKKVVELQPDSADAQSRLGQGLLAAGQETVGLEHLQAALQLDPKSQRADTLLVLNYLRQGNFEAAIKAGQDYRRRNPAEIAPYNLLGQVYLAAGDNDSARNAFEQVLELEPGDPNANHRLAFLAEQAGDMAAARAYYQTVLEHRKNYLPSLMKLIALDAKEGNEDAMLAGLQRAIELHPQAIEPRLALSRYYLSRGRPELAAGLFSELDNVARLRPEIAQVLAKSELDQKNYAAARYYLEVLVEDQPGSAEWHYQLALAYAGEGNSEKMRSELEATIQLNQEHLPARVALARWLLLQQDLAGLETQVVELRRLAPENSDVLQLEAMLSTLKQDPEAALESLQLAFERAPTSASLLTLARQQYALGNTDASKSLMQEWLDEHSTDVSTRIALAQVYLLEGEQDKAMSEFQRVLETDEHNVVALNNLAWYQRHIDPGAALAYAELAAETDPGSAQVMDTLAMVLLSNQKFERASRTITRAISLNPGDPTLHFHAAQILVARGDRQEALALLRPLLETGVGFPEKQEAETLLADLEE